MTNFKITNITNLMGKREKNHNLPLEITISEGLIPKKMKIIPGGFVILKTKKLPLSVHTLRIKGLVEVTHVTNEEVGKLEKPTEKKKVEAIKTTTTTKAPKKTTRRKKIETNTTTKLEKKEQEE